MTSSSLTLSALGALSLALGLGSAASAQNQIITEAELEELLRQKQEQVEAQQPAQQPAPSSATASSQTTAGQGNGPALSPAAIDSATYEGTPLAEGRSALTVKVQVLLDRAGISPGVIDGYSGGMSETAMRAFEARAGLPVDGQLDAELWQALGGPQTSQIIRSYTITEDDVAKLSEAPLPDDYSELAKLDKIGFTSVPEAVAEYFHMDQEFLEALNPGATWQPGETVTVVDIQTGSTPPPAVARIVIDKSSSRLQALDASGSVLTDYPVTIGSTDTPSPSGTHKVLAVAEDPTYSYNPELNFKQGDNDEFLTLPPGPNGPVGSMWIDLDKPTYGLHGTADPDSLFKNQSHGCVRLTNWDAHELAQMVNAGLQSSERDIMVEFRE